MQQEEYEHYNAQSELARQQIEGQQAAYIPQMAEQMQQAQAVLVEQTNPRKTVEEIMLILQGKEETRDGNKVQVREPLMNNLGINKMWVWCKGAINQGIILSHYEDKEIRSIMNALQDDLVDELSLNWKEYGIKNKTDLDLINNIILINVDASFRRALGQNEKNWLGKISIEQISGQQRFVKPKKDTFWSKFKL